MRHPSTLPITLGELARIQPLAGAETHLADPARKVEQVVLAETFERLRRCTPHVLVVLHDEAATGGWSLASALHLAWERNLSAVVVSRAVAGGSSVALAERLNMSLIVIDEDPIDLALQLAGQVSAPAAARALRQARLAELLAEQTGIRGVLGVLNRELQQVPVALVMGGVVIAGQSAALTERPQVRQIEVEVHAPGERSAARLVAAVPVPGPAAVDQVESLLRLARPSLQAAWALSRLDAATRAAHEQAAFGLLRRLAGEPTPSEPAEIEAPSWASELGWQVGEANRAVWLAPVRPSGEPAPEITFLVRASWQRGHTTWPLVAEGDGWISWHSAADPDDVSALRRALATFRESAVAHRLVIGVGRAHAGVGGLMRSVAEARLAAHVAREDGPGAVQWFDQVGANAALAWLPTTEIAQVADLCLEDLMAARDRAALVQTVLAVLDAGGSLSQASQQLGVHRNTVLARLARARQFGLTFEEPGQRLALHVLCYALASLWSDATPDADGH
ncbi:helix-turn-helix domain-containing protein [Actinoplanes sp. LDG1-06]|uniref:Helix-turn-helix domain-containing protein n=1 Tax=Paractinoplanes ovalisporus TaxID=2810368 RepID=A0ABS2A8S4_9ACTN|nr:helix-turn-helix domain-containing protein [Actinoplanes ovalisporus]MBM2615651.1 helix-turn-helix domain-containing protein [Actinoplanes ovalisporus]